GRGAVCPSLPPAPEERGSPPRPSTAGARSGEGIIFGPPNTPPPSLFFRLALKYDRLHLPILGRLARALRNPATIAKLRALSSPDQVRALLLKEDANVRAGLVPEFRAEAFRPKLDKTLRLRAIRRLQQQKKPEPEPAENKAREAQTQRRVMQRDMS